MNATSSVSLAFDPLLPWEVLAVLAGIGLVLVLLGLRAGARGTIWRAGSVAIVLAALANPALVEEQRKPIADIALIVTDDSDSMAIGDRRLQVAAAREALRRIGELQQHGLVERVGDSEDKRRSIVSLTRQGLQALDNFFDAYAGRSARH